MIIVRAIKPGKPFQSSIFRDEVRREADAVRKDMLDDFNRTTATWQHKVRFTSKVQASAGAGGVRIEVSTKDPIYGYIDQGTRVRYATMSPDFSPKTQPDVILSVPGKGRRLFVNKKRPRPGIKARNFSKIIAKSYFKEFRRRMQNALDRFARRVQ